MSRRKSRSKASAAKTALMPDAVPAEASGLFFADDEFIDTEAPGRMIPDAPLKPRDAEDVARAWVDTVAKIKASRIAGINVDALVAEEQSLRQTLQALLAEVEE